MFGAPSTNNVPLEIEGDDANPTKAAKHLGEAERYAARAPYTDLLTRIRALLATVRVAEGAKG